MNGKPDPGEHWHDTEDVVAAVLEAYQPNALQRWWVSWLNADPKSRYGMEAGVLAVWSGRKVKVQE